MPQWKTPVAAPRDSAGYRSEIRLTPIGLQPASLKAKSKDRVFVLLRSHLFVLYHVTHTHISVFSVFLLFTYSTYSA